MHTALKPVAITAATQNQFEPFIRATSATLAANTATQWTGAASLALYASVTRDIADLATTIRTQGYIPPSYVLHRMAHTPKKLHSAACHLISEALPAMVNSATDRPAAADTAKQIVASFNTYGTPNWMALHQLMQGDSALISEVNKWTGQDGMLIKAAEMLSLHFHVFAVLCTKLAPESNTQCLMLAHDADMHLAELKSTLKRLH